jgi:hypothetical protein
MNDRELLELAAKAANVDFYTPEGMDAPWCGSGFYLRGCAVWNPLTDDGDALRLAVKLGIELLFTKNRVGAGRHSPAAAPWAAEDRNVDDPYSATRRAIVRAAVAIGEKMETKPWPPRS